MVDETAEKAFRRAEGAMSSAASARRFDLFI